MKGPFAFLLILGGAILLYGLFTGKINLGSASIPSGNILQQTASKAGLAPAPIVGSCPKGQAKVAGSCRQDPHNCGDGMIWIDASKRCAPISF